LGVLFIIFQPVCFKKSSRLRESLCEQLRQQNKQAVLISGSNCFHFCSIYCCNVAYDRVFISLHDHCNRSTQIYVVGSRLIDLICFAGIDSFAFQLLKEI